MNSKPVLYYDANRNQEYTKLRGVKIYKKSDSEQVPKMQEKRDVNTTAKSRGFIKRANTSAWYLLGERKIKVRTNKDDKRMVKL